MPPLYSQIKETLRKRFSHQAQSLGKDLHTTNQPITSLVGIITGAKAKHFTMRAVSHIPGANVGSGAS